MVAAVKTSTLDTTEDSRKIHIFLGTFVEAVGVARTIFYNWEGTYW